MRTYQRRKMKVRRLKLSLPKYDNLEISMGKLTEPYLHVGVSVTYSVDRTQHGRTTREHTRITIRDIDIWREPSPPEVALANLVVDRCPYPVEPNYHHLLEWDRTRRVLGL